MKKIVYGALAFAPVFAFAQAFSTGGIFDQIVTFIARTVRALIPIAFGLAVLYFFYGIAKYVSSAGDEKAAQSGKSIMIYGVIAIAVMASIWGIVGWLQTNFGLGTVAPTQNVALPNVTAGTSI
jgi:hypothetical protein